MTTVSIGLPVYNGDRYLEQAIDSALAQTYEDFDLVISDNASTDHTREICEAFAKRDSRIRYYRNAENMGPIWNFNRVAELRSGRYFKWLNHDDAWAPTLLEHTVAVLDEAPSTVVLCYPKTVFIDEHGATIEFYDDRLDLRASSAHERLGGLVRNLRRCNALFGLMRSDALGRTRPMGAFVSSDKVLLAELSLLGQFWEVDELLFLRRLHPAGSTFANKNFLERARWCGPANHDLRVVYPRWRLLAEHLWAIQHVCGPSSERRRCYATLMRTWMGRYGPGMLRDLQSAGVRIVGMTSPAIGRRLSGGL